MSTAATRRTAHLELPWLQAVDLEARAQVGAKAAVLGTLLHAGVPVPEGFCVPEPALRRLVAVPPDSPEWEALQASYRQLSPHGEPVVVRSSAAGEDGRTASFAGQFETVTDIRSDEELCSAVLHCWQAAGGERVKGYGAKRRTGPGAFHLFVQRQVEAVVSGVLFTRDPVSGASSPLLVEAGPGLGEALLAGRRSPWTVRLERSGQAHFGGNGKTRTALEQVPWPQLAQQAAQIEACLGPGQDVEWAYGAAGGAPQLWILQARPVTTGGDGLSHGLYWTRANVAEVLPNPVTPLTWTVFKHTLLGSRPGGEAFVRQVNGRVYVRLDGFISSFSYLPAVTPEVMTQVLGVALPVEGQDFSTHVTLPVRLAQGLFWLDALAGVPRLRWLIERLPELPPPGMQHLPAVLDWTTALFQLHLKTTGYAISAYAVLARLLERWMPSGQSAELLAALLHGQADLQTARQGQELWEMAAEIQAHPPLAGLVSARFPWKIFRWQAERLEGGRLFLERLERFLADHGARAAGEFELATPRWKEDPQALLAMLAGYLAAQQAGSYFQAHSPQEMDRRRKAALAALAQDLNPVQLRVIERLLEAYQRYTTWRENVKYRLMEGYAQLRQAFLEIGHQLVTTGWLSKPEDIFFLCLTELPGFSFTNAGVPNQNEIDARRLELAGCQELPAPALWVEHFPTSQEAPAHGSLRPAAGAGTGLHGIGCSSGVVEGTARVIRRIEDSVELRPGEVLVAPHTDPGWTPLFLICTAVVTEVGGFLSHGATVAREYGLPCVVNVPLATQRIRTGDWVRVDGAAGQVTILAPGEAPA